MKRFWSKVDKSDDCWLWTASVNAAGYGRFNFEGTTQLAHRVAFFLEFGKFPLIGRHTCDNPPCVRPSHIQDGTSSDNMQDAKERGRLVQVVDVGAVQRNKTRCPQDHEYTEENTRITKEGHRKCRTCHRQREQKRRHEQ